MISKIIRKKDSYRSTEISRFVRSASSGEKKKIFSRVIDKSINDQNKILKTK